MIVVQNFIPCVEDELKVERGQIVKALYQENEWWFVVDENGGEGFIPYTFCIPIGDSAVKSKQQLFSMGKNHAPDLNGIGNCTAKYFCNSLRVSCSLFGCSLKGQH